MISHATNHIHGIMKTLNHNSSLIRSKSHNNGDMMSTWNNTTEYSVHVHSLSHRSLPGTKEDRRANTKIFPRPCPPTYQTLYPCIKMLMLMRVLELVKIAWYSQSVMIVHPPICEPRWAPWHETKKRKSSGNVQSTRWSRSTSPFAKRRRRRRSKISWSNQILRNPNRMI